MIDTPYKVNYNMGKVAFTRTLGMCKSSMCNPEEGEQVCVCVQVSSELVVHAERSPGFQFNLREVRKRMVGQETSDLLRYVYGGELARKVWSICKNELQNQFVYEICLLSNL